MGRKKQFDFPACHPEASYFAKNLCRSCYNRIDKKQRKKTLRAIPTAFKVWQFNKNHPQAKITVEQYEDTYVAYGGTCQICGSDKDLHIDHDHASGAFRGFLCKHCNWGLGQFKDDPNLLKHAIEYLQRGGEK